MNQLPKQGRLYWSCRRGMLELDLFLIPFLQQCFSSLSTQQQEQFIALLNCTDTELYAWLTGSTEVPDPALAEIVTLVKDHAPDADKSSVM